MEKEKPVNEALEKNIRQMRGMFAFFAVVFTVFGLPALALLIAGSANEDGGWDTVLPLLGFAVLFWVAFLFTAKGRRNRLGFHAAQLCSVLFLFAFPILTFFGISYLIKLNAWEMKEAFGL